LVLRIQGDKMSFEKNITQKVAQCIFVKMNRLPVEKRNPKMWVTSVIFKKLDWAN
jgi:hypothetical protein